MSLTTKALYKNMMARMSKPVGLRKIQITNYKIRNHDVSKYITKVSEKPIRPIKGHEDFKKHLSKYIKTDTY